MRKLLSLAVGTLIGVLMIIPDATAKVAYRTAVLATAYAPGCGDSGRTASGTRPDWGTVAVSRSQFRFGTRFYIPGYGRGVALDTGGAIGWGHIDLWFPTCSQAYAWGARRVAVSVLR